MRQNSRQTQRHKTQRTQKWAVNNSFDSTADNTEELSNKKETIQLRAEARNKGKATVMRQGESQSSFRVCAQDNRGARCEEGEIP